MFLRSAFNYDTDMVSEETGLRCEDPSKTQQNQRDEADINTIVRRFGLTGQLPENVRIPQYGDFTGVTDYQTALNAVKAAETAFMVLPADLRAKFDNDPHLYVEFCTNPDNADELVKLGLAVRKEQEKPADKPAEKPVEKPAA